MLNRRTRGKSAHQRKRGLSCATLFTAQKAPRNWRVISTLDAVTTRENVQKQGEIQASRRIRVRKKKIARATHRESIHAYVRACEYIAKLGEKGVAPALGIEEICIAG